MNKLVLTLGLIACCSFFTKAQKIDKKWDGNVYEVVRSYDIGEGKPKKNETYVFKSYKDKEQVLLAVYKKMTKKLQEGKYTEEEIEKDRKELVTLMKGKVEEPVDA